MMNIWSIHALLFLWSHFAHPPILHESMELWSLILRIPKYNVYTVLIRRKTPPSPELTASKVLTLICWAALNTSVLFSTTNCVWSLVLPQQKESNNNLFPEEKCQDHPFQTEFELLPSSHRLRMPVMKTKRFKVSLSLLPFDD